MNAGVALGTGERAAPLRLLFFRGAGDLSFVAPFIPGVDGLGALGNGAHSPQETVHLPSLQMQTERAAVLMLRLSGIRK